MDKTDRQTDRQTDGQTDRRTDRQTDTHTNQSTTHLILFLLEVLSEFNELFGRPEDVEQLPYQHEFLCLPHKNDVIIEIE